MNEATAAARKSLADLHFHPGTSRTRGGTSAFLPLRHPARCLHLRGLAHRPSRRWLDAMNR